MNILKKIAVPTIISLSFMASPYASEEGIKKEDLTPTLTLTLPQNVKLAEGLENWSYFKLTDAVTGFFTEKYGKLKQEYFTRGWCGEKLVLPSELARIPKLITQYAGRNELIFLDLRDQDRAEELKKLYDDNSYHNNYGLKTVLQRIVGVNLYHVRAGAHYSHELQEFLSHLHTGLYEIDLGFNHMFESAVRSLITELFYLDKRGAKLTSLNLSGNGVGDSDELLMYLIRHCPNLEKLYLRQNRITSKAAIFMGRELSEKGCHLSVLDLGRNSIGDEGIEAIGPGLASIQDLDLAGCSIGPRGLKSMSDFLKSCHTLNLNGNPLTSESAQALGHLLEGGSLTHLNLAFCDFGDDGVSAIAPSFQRLKFLNLSGNGVTGRGGEAIFPNLRDIVELYFNRNDLGKGGIGVIRPGSLENLKVLSMKENALGDAALTSLAAAMPNVETLMLGHNEIGDAGLASLAATRGPGLTKLSLWKNLIGDEGLTALSTSHMAQTLIELVLGKNKVTSAGIQAMEPSQFPSLKRLYINDNDINDEGGPALFPFIPQLDKLFVENCSFSTAILRSFVDKQGDGKNEEKFGKYFTSQRKKKL